VAGPHTTSGDYHPRKWLCRRAQCRGVAERNASRAGRRSQIALVLALPFLILILALILALYPIVSRPARPAEPAVVLLPTPTPTLSPAELSARAELLEINQQAAALVGYLAIVEADERPAIIGQVIGELKHLEAQAALTSSPLATFQAATIREMRIGLERVRNRGDTTLLMQASRINAALRMILRQSSGQILEIEENEQ